MSGDDRFNLYIELKRRNIKLKDAAEHLKCSSALISMYLSGKCEMDYQKVIKLKQLVKDEVI